MIYRTVVDLDGKVYEWPVTTPQFFFDTADVDYIESLWFRMAGLVEPTSVLGVTTNPNALSKVQCVTLKDLGRLIPRLCHLVSRIRHGIPGGVVYVQVPNSVMTPEQIFDFANRIVGMSDGFTPVGLKIPHFTHALQLTDELDELDLNVNVTGIADWGTVLKALAYPGVTYASIIPGRMEERKVNANAHLDYIAHVPRLPHQSVIAGSMRTIEGLKNAVARNTIPTIGTRVWDQLTDLRSFPSFWRTPTPTTPSALEHAPVITEDCRTLSIEFFQQMDQLGQPMYLELLQETVK